MTLNIDDEHELFLDGEFFELDDSEELAEYAKRKQAFLDCIVRDYTQLLLRFHVELQRRADFEMRFRELGEAALSGYEKKSITII